MTHGRSRAISDQAVALVTDSNAQLPTSLARSLGLVVVDIPITIDGVSRGESEIDVDEFYERLAEGAEISTSQPSPGKFADAYAKLAALGFGRIVSIHVGSDFSGTVNSARLGAEATEAQVDVVDTGQTSFALGLCAWAAAEAVGQGGSAGGAISAARLTADRVGNVFVLSALDIARETGRVEVTGDDVDSASIPVVSLVERELNVVGEASDVAMASAAMVSTVAEVPGPIRVGIGVGDIGAMDFYDALHDPVAALDNVAEVVRYRCGPSVGAFSGPGVAGMAWAPIEVG